MIKRSSTKFILVLSLKEQFTRMYYYHWKMLFRHCCTDVTAYAQRKYNAYTYAKQKNSGLLLCSCIDY